MATKSASSVNKSPKPGIPGWFQLAENVANTFLIACSSELSPISLRHVPVHSKQSNATRRTAMIVLHSICSTIRPFLIPDLLEQPVLLNAACWRAEGRYLGGGIYVAAMSPS